MKIFIPTILSTGRTVGVAEYLVNLIKNLENIDEQNEYYILTTPHNRYMFKLRNKNFHEIIVNIYDFSRIYLRVNYYVWQLLQFKKIVKRLNIDIIHFPCPWFIPKTLRSVTTVHDMTEFNTLKYGRLNNHIKKEMIKSSLRNSSEIIAVSESTKNDIRKFIPINVHMIYNGVSEINNEPLNSETILKKYNIVSKKYFVFIGTLQKHKNIKNIIEAFNIFSSYNKEFTLVLIGKKDNAVNEINKKISESGLTNSVRLLGYLPEKEKNIFLSRAFCLLYPSLYEGFGFPILDAQLRGVPVITSNISSMPEISGDGAVLVNPTDSTNIADAMSLLVQNKSLVPDLITKGYENVKRFSWTKCAEQTLAVYQNIFTHPF